MRDDVFEIQRLYPQIYLACHNHHIRATQPNFVFLHRTGRFWSISIVKTGIRPNALAKHLGVAASTLSATISRLEKLGYSSSTPAANDKRQRELKLTARELKPSPPLQC